MADSVPLAVIVLTFLFAGFVKGVVGFGLPSVALAVLTAVIGLHPAMALLLMPSLMTNLWQACQGGHFRKILRRVWPFLLVATLTVWVGAQALRRVDVWVLSALLGVLLVAYALVGLRGPRIRIRPAWEMWAGPLLGAVNGVLTGLTGSFVFPGVLYLQAIGLPRDSLVQAMGLLFTTSTIGLTLALGSQELLTAQLGLLSAAGVVPAVVGMMLGQKVRHRIAEGHFRQVFLMALLLLGLYIVFTSF
ncbi:sulfite exporter TauE/SafE family protein [Deinococcus peraridilitoris]|uniref:Probable membrane transporter protein n=1 Tax=Deinococcus peraridilitoris (strain DSM 19664 / LMG 22246 / CIP 109416 / KR-200) TaxID=937777 RepID=K9ZX79_DEIPD|nr:sulfite exporter TauE/SafE family protein [Deinococcus peraridilitoris]AFZ66258.1 putative permease [Deinococcus peraridilitoris DSM 19664]